MPLPGPHGKSKKLKFLAPARAPALGPWALGWKTRGPGPRPVGPAPWAHGPFFWMCLGPLFPWYPLYVESTGVCVRA